MSEPDAGSDLASAGGRRPASDTGYLLVVNGQKTWNSLGRAPYGATLTVPPTPMCPSTRISTLSVDMTMPGSKPVPVSTHGGRPDILESSSPTSWSPVTSWQSQRGRRVAMTTLSYERAGVARLHLKPARPIELPDGRRQGFFRPSQPPWSSATASWRSMPGSPPWDGPPCGNSRPSGPGRQPSATRPAG